MGRPKKNERKADTVELLLAAAEKRFASHGFHETSLADIAADAGIGAPSLLYHFASKDALFEEMLRRFYTSLSEILDRTLAGNGSAQEIFIRAFSEVARLHRRQNEGILRVMVSELIGPNGRGANVVAEFAPPLLDRVEEVIRANARPPIPEHAPVRQVILQLLMGYLARIAHGELAGSLWGETDQTAEIAQALFKTLQKWGKT